jgi:hypothetical protein
MMNDDEIRRRMRSAAELHGVSPREVAAEIVGDEPEETDEEPKRRGKGYWVAWSTSMVVMGVMTGGLIVAAMKFVNDPVVASGKVLSEAEKSAAPAPETAKTSRLAGLNIELVYPGMFDQLAQVKSDPQVIEQYTLSSKNNFRHLLAVEVRPLVSGGLDDDASYRVRKIHAGEYVETGDRSGDEKIAIMTKADKTEQTLFWPHKGKLLTISLTSTDPKDDLPSIMGVIKGALRWKQ